MFGGKSPEWVYIQKFRSPSIVKTADKQSYQCHSEATKRNQFLAHIQSHPKELSKYQWQVIWLGFIWQSPVLSCTCIQIHTVHVGYGMHKIEQCAKYIIYNTVFWISNQLQATLQNSQRLIYISLDHKKASCGMLLSTRSTKMLHTFLKHWYLGAWSWTMSFSNNCCELSSEYTSSLKKKKKNQLIAMHTS